MLEIHKLRGLFVEQNCTEGISFLDATTEAIEKWFVLVEERDFGNKTYRCQIQTDAGVREFIFPSKHNKPESVLPLPIRAFFALHSPLVD